jgi:signal transduction histidine kinase
MSRISNGNSHELIKIARDLTDKKLIEQHKDEFIGVASHELKTPVTTIKTYSELLEERLKGSSDINTATLVSKLNIQVACLTNLVTDLLDVTKISEGQLQVNKEEFSLNELIEKCLEEVRLTNPDREFVYRPGNNIIVFSDRSRIEQVIVNFLSNSIKYSSGKGKIIISTVSDTKKITICITDFGIGMSEETKQKAFERFYRSGDFKNEALPGLGLGLFIASSIVHKLGGDIWVESEQGKGASFYFSIPISS